MRNNEHNIKTDLDCRELYEKWAFTPYDGPLWNFKKATWEAWKSGWNAAKETKK